MERASAGAREPSLQWTGKELDEYAAAYYFGARWYDADLLTWMVPDPAGQFANPYAYGGDPVNGVDEYGLWFGWDDAIAAGIGFVTGYVYHGATTGHWGWSAVKAGAVGAAVSWLTYNTAGAAAELMSGSSAIEAGVAMGEAGGIAAGASNYTLSTLANGDTWYADQMGQSMVVGGLSGAASGAVGNYLDSGLSTSGPHRPQRSACLKQSPQIIPGLK